MKLDMKLESILVLGIGNLLCADDGFGVRAVEALDRRWQFPANVSVLDGGTQGFGLLTRVLAARRLIVFDAVDLGLAPGTLTVLEDDEVLRFMGTNKLSLHQTGFHEVLYAAELIGQFPAELVLIGVQPADVGHFAGDLSGIVQERIADAQEIALARLQRWGCPAKARESASSSALLPAGLGAEAFGLRPAARQTGG